MTEPQILRALIEGLDFHEADITPTARKALEQVARELAGLEGLNLDVLRQARKLYEATRPESELLSISRLPLHYPDLARVWRHLRQRPRWLELLQGK